MNNKKILIYIPARLGDALMQSPVIKLIADNNKSASIDLIVMSSIAYDLYQNSPYVSKVIKFDNKETFRKLSAGYDVFLVAHHDSLAPELIYKINCRVIFIENVDFKVHQVIQSVKFIKDIFDFNGKVNLNECRYEVFTTESDDTYAKLKLSDDKTYIGFHLGCHGIAKVRNWLWPAKQTKHEKAWSIQKFIELAKLFKSDNPEVVFVLTGSQSEKKLSKAFIKTYPDTIALFGDTTVGKLKCVIDNLAVFISGDTGPMHIACATQTPLIAIFGKTNSIRTGPFPAENYRRIIQNDNINDITPKEVFLLANSIMDLA